MRHAVPVSPRERLPLTCTRAGTCCHGKRVRLNPWELAQLARARGLSPAAFRDLFTECGGFWLRFDGPPGYRGLPACSQYGPGGCRAYEGRPLSCRLYPLGRELRSGEARFVYQGPAFPCLEGCPEVVAGAHLTLDEYLAGQEVERACEAQDLYLEVARELADLAFALLFESALAPGDEGALQGWSGLAERIGRGELDAVEPSWLALLAAPPLDPLAEPAAFAKAHLRLLEERARAELFSAADRAALREGCRALMAMALAVAEGVGADAGALERRWIQSARELRAGAAAAPAGSGASGEGSAG